ncbi:zf-HC2 domain-containing protein [Saccharothrix violaceirubra]|uniref:Putative zinc-finger domain-containing protein n=1 Tax=Saccharothrix violaceirubra TaxID=413306 RepID=A0A7W7T324_9PSEU|nr:zf-HC2 domain-containing protein [Saccharothrix violaceirubra]MBB4964440.1 hypothetical protein [Saccharothrix violaceirubra]
MTTNHDPRLLGAYVLGVLDEREARAVEHHLSDCAHCRSELDDLRAAEAALGDLPPEALLDGPPEDGDLLLRRTLRQVRKERVGRVRARGLGAAAAAVVVAVVVLGGGFAVGRGTAPTPDASSSTTVAPPDNAERKLATGVDPATGARMTVEIRRAVGWVRVNASVSGVAQGRECRLVVVGKDGTTREAGSWLVSKLGEREGTNLDGSALVEFSDVTAVEVRDFTGERIVSVDL